MGTNNLLDVIINVIGRVYLHLSAADQGRECHKYAESLVDDHNCFWLTYRGDTKGLMTLQPHMIFIWEFNRYSTHIVWSAVHASAKFIKK